MKRLGFVVMFLLAACNKPSEENCRKALDNMEHLLGTDNLLTPGQLESEVRRCKGGSSKTAVECAIKATTLDELEKCDFYKPNKGSGSAQGSGSAK